MGRIQVAELVTIAEIQGYWKYPIYVHGTPRTREQRLSPSETKSWIGQNIREKEGRPRRTVFKPGIPMVALFTHLVCSTYRIPAFQLCYPCYPKTCISTISKHDPTQPKERSKFLRQETPKQSRVCEAGYNPRKFNSHGRCRQPTPIEQTFNVRAEVRSVSDFF